MKKDYGKKTTTCFLLALAYPVSINTFKNRIKRNIKLTPQIYFCNSNALSFKGQSEGKKRHCLVIYNHYTS